MHRIWLFLYSLLLLALVSGCASGPGAVPVLRYDPAAITDGLLKEYDRNGNGSIEDAELDGCPALKSALSAIDSNKDRKLSREELVRRFERYAAAGQESIVSCSCLVSLKGMPVAGIQVKLVPEKAMGTAFKPAIGVTTPEGIAVLKVEGDTRAGVPAGLYRIQLTKDVSGTQDIPASYATGDRIGREVFDDGRSSGALLELMLNPGG